ncbi:hypothetical protein WJS89_01915 [Sphingomicrobium sp. XHP0235]|uniref:hypothetical protein n=1 Tax=Sphingomicrobium aquimarinum TaxID=3133971 RepID=UPI0031FF34DB
MKAANLNSYEGVGSGRTVSVVVRPELQAGFYELAKDLVETDRRELRYFSQHGLAIPRTWSIEEVLDLQRALIDLGLTPKFEPRSFGRLVYAETLRRCGIPSGDFTFQESSDKETEIVTFGGSGEPFSDSKHACIAAMIGWFAPQFKHPQQETAFVEWLTANVKPERFVSSDAYPVESK